MTATNTAHPSHQALRAYGLGQLDRAQAQELEDHLDGCAGCVAVLDELPPDDFIDVLRVACAISGVDVQARSLDETSAALESDTEAPEPPHELHGHARYRVLRRIGRGGMGAVYRAEHTLMERPVALKVIAPRLLEHEGALARFRQEIRTAARLHHPNIVTAFDAEQVGPLTVLVMEYVEGRSLAEHLKEVGPLPIAQACDHVRQAALGLQYAHEQGMVHRDIKPHNLMLTPSGQVKILDFGLARFVSEGLDSSPTELVVGTVLPASTPSPEAELTGSGACMGTIDYIAPEQARDARQADGRADVYSLGSTLYHLLTGRMPFPEGSALEKLARLSTTDPTPVRELRPDVPPALAALVERMMAKRPQDRCQSAAEVAEALTPYASRAPQPPRRRRRLLMGLIGLLLALGAGIAASVVRVATDRGEVVIETDDPEVEVVVKGDRIVRITDPKTGRSYDLDRTELALTRADDPDGLRVTLDGVRPVVLKRQGKRIAAVWLERHQAPKTREVRKINWPGMRLYCTAFSSDGRLHLACGEFPSDSSRSMVRVWETGTGRLVSEFPGGQHAAFTPDGREVITVQADRGLALYDVATGKQTRKLPFDGSPVNTVRVSPDGKLAATGHTDGTVLIWDLASGKQVRKLGEHSSYVAASFLPDGKLVSRGTELCLWDLSTGKQLRRWRNLPPDLSSTALFGVTGYDARTRQILTCSPAGVHTWGAKIDKPASTVKTAEPAEYAWAFAPDGRRFLYSSMRDSTVRLVELPGGEESTRFKVESLPQGHLAISPDGRYATGATENGWVYLWRLPDRPGSAARPVRPEGDEALVRDLAWPGSAEADFELSVEIIRVEGPNIPQGGVSESSERELEVAAEVLWSHAGRNNRSRPPARQTVLARATFQPELGESAAAARAKIVNKMAWRMVADLERPW